MKLASLKNRLGRMLGWDKPDDPPVGESQSAPKQQWEKLASRGHQLLAQVLVIQGRKEVYLMIVGFGVFLVPVALWLASNFAVAGAAAAGWMVERGYSVASSVTGTVRSFTRDEGAVTSTKAPKVAAIRYVETQATVDPSLILNIDQVRERMLAWGPMLDKGQAIPEDQCRQDKKIHESWFGDSDAKIRCRISADKKRVWAWGWALASEDPKRRAPFDTREAGGGYAAVLYRAAGNEGWTLSRLDIGRGNTISIHVDDLIEEAVKKAEAANPVDKDSVKTEMDSKSRQEQAKVAAREAFAINLARVPRSIASDFPELVLEAAPASVNPTGEMK